MKKMLFSLMIALVAVGCSQPKLNLPADSGKVVGLNTLLTLSEGENLIHLQDFIPQSHEIDSITCSSSAVTCHLSPDKLTALVMVSSEMPQFIDLQLWVLGVPYSVPARKSDKIDYVFTYDPQGKKLNRVQLAGQMNNWVASMTPDLQLNADGVYEVKLQISPGTYLYQMAIDGDQSHDKTNPNKVDNGYGKFNSILQVNGYETEFPVLRTKIFSDKEIELSLTNEATEVYAYWQNYRLPAEFISHNSQGVIVKLPLEASQLERSYIRVWAANKYGVSNDILVPLHDGKVLQSSDNLTRFDKYANIIYFMLVDRFKNGNPENDQPLNRPDVKPQADYQGGDLAGLQQEITNDYFTNLGVNTLWVSPLSQNPLEPFGYSKVGKTKFAGYHGYWPISSSKVDFRFGSNDELKALVSEAHHRNINVLLDYVANHVHKDHPLYKNHPEYATPLYLPDGRMNTELWDEQRLTTWFDTFMPSLDFGNPEVVNMMVDSALFWMSEFNLDGFRHDACKHVNEEYWRRLTYKLKERDQNGNFYQIGESYGSPELMASYVNSGMLDGQFDFNVFDEATSAFNGVSGGTLTRVSNILRSSLKVYGAHNLMGYISGNHDKPRFMAQASGDLKVGEDGKTVAWTREIGITDSTAYDKFALFHAFNLTIPGVPVIYYGDEIGMTGANDPDSRRMMRFQNWNNREQSLFNQVTTLTHLRRSNLALLYGDFLNLEATDSTWVYARTYFETEVIVVLNNSSEEQSFVFDCKAHSLCAKGLTATFGHTFKKISDGKIEITLPAYSFEVLR